MESELQECEAHQFLQLKRVISDLYLGIMCHQGLGLSKLVKRVPNIDRYKGSKTIAWHSSMIPISDSLEEKHQERVLTAKRLARTSNVLSRLRAASRDDHPQWIFYQRHVYRRLEPGEEPQDVNTCLLLLGFYKTYPLPRPPLRKAGGISVDSGCAVGAIDGYGIDF